MPKASEKHKETTEDRTIDHLETGKPGDFISQREYEALQEFKKHPITENYPDRYLLAFLFGRKLDVERAVELLTANAKWRKEAGYEDTSNLTVNEDLYNKRYMLVPGTRAKTGHVISYLFAGRIRFKDFPLKDHMDFMVWFWEHMYNNLTIDVFRDGMTVIEDIHGAGLANFDMKMSKEISSVFQDRFPMRIKLIIVVDPPTIVRIMIAFARLFVKAKIIQRVKLLKKAELAEYVDHDQLSDEFGGGNPWRQPPLSTVLPSRGQKDDFVGTDSGMTE